MTKVRDVMTKDVLTVYPETPIRDYLALNDLKFTIKLTTNWLPIGHNLAKYGNINNLCHRCNQVEQHQGVVSDTHVDRKLLGRARASRWALGNGQKHRSGRHG